MTEDDIARIDKQFDSLEETLRRGFDRMGSKLEQFGETLKLFAQVNTRLDAVERTAEERHTEVLEAIRNLKR